MIPPTRGEDDAGVIKLNRRKAHNRGDGWKEKNVGNKYHPQSKRGGKKKGILSLDREANDAGGSFERGDSGGERWGFDEGRL